jgi:hypothetical protein
LTLKSWESEGVLGIAPAVGIGMTVRNLAERWGRLQAWCAIAGKTKVAWRTMEWLLALAWPIVAYDAVFNRYAWNSQYYNKWQESWFALVLLVPMVGPALARFFSSSGMDLQKRFTLAGIIAVGVVVAIMFRPHFGGVSFMSFFVPLALQASAVYLWLRWRKSSHKVTARHQ